MKKISHVAFLYFMFAASLVGVAAIHLFMVGPWVSIFRYTYINFLPLCKLANINTVIIVVVIKRLLVLAYWLNSKWPLV